MQILLKTVLLLLLLLLLGFECRCGNLYCSLHRYADKHDCSFDYKKLGREEIQKRNPKVVANKIERI